jgi:hypothetical protein
MRYLSLLLLLPLAGCSHLLYLSSGADEHGGTVYYVTDRSQDGALAKANEHCHQYKLVAHVIMMDLPSGTMTFSCQPPE